MARYNIQGTALTQVGRELRVIPNADISILDASGNLAVIYATETSIPAVANPAKADKNGAYDFWADIDEAYYDVVISSQGRTATDRVEVASAGGIAVDQTARDAAFLAAVPFPTRAAFTIARLSGNVANDQHVVIYLDERHDPPRPTMGDALSIENMPAE